jgi:hypothetical protein
MRRSVLLLAVAAYAATPNVASAADYTVDVCRHTDGTPAPAYGWEPSITDDTPAGNIAQNSCAQGGHIDLALGAGAHSTQASALLVGTLGPGTTWTRVQAWMAYRSSPTTPAEDPAHKVALTIAGEQPCAWGMGAGCSLFGSWGAAPLSDVNRYTVTAKSPDQPLTLGVVCDGGCPATSGDPAAQVRVWRIAVDVNVPAPTEPATHDTGQPAPTGSPGRVHNGSGKASRGRLTARLRRDRKGRLHLTGRLTDLKHRPIRNAQLVVKRSPGKAVRVTTGRDGRYHRVLGTGQRVVVRWYPWSDSTQHLSAKGKTR